MFFLKISAVMESSDTSLSMFFVRGSKKKFDHFKMFENALIGDGGSSSSETLTEETSDDKEAQNDSPSQPKRAKKIGVVRKSKKRGGSTNRKNRAAEIAEEDCDPFGATVRFRNYCAIWKQVKSKIDGSRERSHHDVIKEVSNSIFKEDNSRNQCDDRPSLLPVIALQLGQNLSDHEEIFTELCNSLTEKSSNKLSCLSLRLRASNCSTVRKSIDSIIRGFLNPIIDEDSGDRSDISRFLQSMNIDFNRNSAALTLGDLAEVVALKPKNVKFEKQRKFVLIFEDFQLFDSVVLNDTIRICSNYSRKLPFVFVFGLTNTVEIALAEKLSQEVPSLVEISKFSLPSPAKNFRQLFTEWTFDSEIPFKLPAPIFRMIAEQFWSSNFSMSNHEKNAKFCILKFFLTNPATVLACQDVHVEEIVAEMGNKRLHKEFASLRSFVDGIELERKVDGKDFWEDLKNNRAQLEEDMRRYMCELDEYNRSFLPALTCFQVFLQDIPDCPFPTDIIELYMMVQCPEFLCSKTNTDKWTELLRTLQYVWHQDTALERVGQCLEILNQGITAELFSNEIKALKQWKARLLNVESEAAKEEHQRRLKTLEAKAYDSPSAKKDAKLKFHEMQDKMRHRIQLCKNSDVYKVLLSKLLAWFHGQFFKVHLMDYTDQPMHETQWVNLNETKLRRELCGDEDLTRAGLKRPETYFGCERAADDVDLCVAFKLYTEHKVRISVNDWMQGFIQRVSGGKKTNKKSEDLMKSRFYRALGELEYLGFVKHSPKNPGKVIKLLGVADEILDEDLEMAEMWKDEDDGSGMMDAE